MTDAPIFLASNEADADVLRDAGLGAVFHAGHEWTLQDDEAFFDRVVIVARPAGASGLAFSQTILSNLFGVAQKVHTFQLSEILEGIEQRKLKAVKAPEAVVTGHIEEPEAQGPAHKRKGSTKYAPVFNGLWDVKHVQKMGMAIYIFGELLDRSKAGVVTVTYRELFEKTQIPVRTIERWMKCLKSGNYILVSGKNPMTIKIRNYRQIKGGIIQSKMDENETNDPARCGGIEDISKPPDVAGLQGAKPPDMAGRNNGAKPPTLAGTLQNVAGRDETTPLNSTNCKSSLKDKSTSCQELKIPDVLSSGKKAKKNPPKKYNFADQDLKLAELIRGKILELNPNHRAPQKLDSWANEIRLMRERDNRPPEKIKAVFLWANCDSFWRGNILSPSKLRSQFDQLTIKMANGNGNGNGHTPELTEEEQRDRAERVCLANEKLDARLGMT